MARTLFYTARSPFARKVRIVLREKNLPFQLVEVDLANRSPEFVQISPLGKVPVLVDEDGTTLFDSTVMLEYLDDRYPAIPMLGADWRERLQNRSIDELADTVAENAVTVFFARTRGDAHTEDRALAVAHKALSELDRRARENAWPVSFSAADAAVIAALGYFDLRLGHEPLAPYIALLARAGAHAARPSVAESVPRA